MKNSVRNYVRNNRSSVMIRAWETSVSLEAGSAALRFLALRYQAQGAAAAGCSHGGLWGDRFRDRDDGVRLQNAKVQGMTSVWLTVTTVWLTAWLPAHARTVFFDS